MESPIKRVGERVEWTHKDGDLYKATGVLVNGKRFEPIISDNWLHIRSINLYRGSKWLLRDGKSYLIERVY